MELVHKDKKKNLDKMIDFIRLAGSEKSDIVVFPELSYTGYILKDEEFKEVSESVNGFFVNKLKEEAIKNNIYIIGGYVEKSDEKIYNSVVFISNKGEVLINYRKNYLWKKEKRVFSTDDNYYVVDTEFGKIGILICYDMEFPEPARKLGLLGAEIVFVPSCFSKKAENRWDIELNANALFNLNYVVASNVVDKYCCGKSKIIMPNGKNLITASSDNEELITEEIDLNLIKELRNDLPYYEDYKKLS